MTTTATRAAHNGRVTPKKLDPGLITLSLDDLTLDDLCDLETVLSADDMASITGGKPNLRALRGMVWLSMRATDPTATIEDAGRVRISKLDTPTPKTG